MSGAGPSAVPAPPPAVIEDEGHPDYLVGATVAYSEFGPLEFLETFSIRNGDIMDARSLVVRPTIQRAYHWVPIEGLPPQLATKYIPAFIKSALAQILTYRPTNMTDATARRTAIILGTARAVSTALYEVDTRDIIPGEIAHGMFEYVPAETDPTKPQTPERLMVARSAPAGQRAMLRNTLELSDEEKGAVAAVHMCAIGLLPLQGYSLVMTGHHYLSEGTTQSRRAYAVVEKQFWTSSATRTWFQTETAVTQDALWHKAGHPVSMLIKMQLAYDETVPGKLIAAGAGSAAARLPATESTLRAANSYKTLLATVRPLMEITGGRINMAVLLEAIEEVHMYPPHTMRDQLAPGRRTAAGKPPSIPAWVDSRDKALRHLESVLERNAPTVAFAYGFHETLVEQSQGAVGATNTLGGSNSLTKLRSGNHAAYIAGSEHYGDYTAARNARRAAGDYSAPELVME